MPQIEVRVPNIGDFADVPIVDVLVAPGDAVRVEDPIVTLESEKATMEVPSPFAGIVDSVSVHPGDKVSEGSMLLVLGVQTAASPETSPAAVAPASAKASDAAANATAETAKPNANANADANTAAPARANANVNPTAIPAAENPNVAASGGVAPRPDASPTVEADAPRSNGVVHASPSIRRFARELGVDLHAVRGTGPHDRVTRDDVQNFVKGALAVPRDARAASGTAFFDLPALPKIDFAKYGPVETVPLSRIRKLSGPNLHRNWLSIPHVTNNDEADITELEAFRKRINAEHPEAKVTVLAFAIKAVVATLQAFPEVNSSLDGDALVLKKYYNIGFAADTPNGLMVPVLKDAERKGLLAVASETAALAAKAREGKLGAADMSGATFTISSLGGIGGTSFTPIINAPEVAILGLSRAAMRPVWDGAAFVPRLIVPLSLSYDHRVIDGALAARFNAHLAALLSDLRRTML